MRIAIVACGLLLAPAAAAVDRIELAVGRVEAAQGTAAGVHADWQIGGPLRVEIAELQAAQLPAPLRAQLRCADVDTRAGIACAGGRFEAEAAGLGRAAGALSLRVVDARHWQFAVTRGDARLGYNSADGRLAAEALRLAVDARAERRGEPLALTLQLRAASGQAYVEPLFVDFAQHPAQARIEARWSAGTLALQQLHVEQDGVGTIAARGQLAGAAPAQRHRLELEAAFADAAAATALYLQPALAATVLRDATASGGLRVQAQLHDGAAQAAQLQLAGATLQLPALGLALEGLDGALHWQAQAAAAPSRLSWRGGTLGRLPVGAAQLDFSAAGRDFALTAPLRLPVLDGAVRIERLALRALGTAQLGADFAAEIEPIDLRALCRSLGWPEFSGTLAGRLPGLRLHERRLDIDGALTARAFDGDIEVRELTVIDPLGVLPRIAADVRLRRLDLAAVTGAFDFGRITGRLDGDVDDLRLIGWEPVAMRARIYTSPGDRSRHRISQRAIDSISSVGGGPTGLLSRGFMRFFEDFAYDRIGWSCVLDNGICRMDGIGPAKEGNGYVLVRGKGLPRIDVVGYSRQVSWPVFMAQLRSIGQSGPAEVR